MEQIAYVHTFIEVVNKSLRIFKMIYLRRQKESRNKQYRKVAVDQSTTITKKDIKVKA